MNGIKEFVYQKDSISREFVASWMEQNGVPEYYKNKLTASVFKWLDDNQYTEKNNNVRRVTDKGKTNGLHEGECINKRGETYVAVIFEKDIQRILWNVLPALKEGIDKENGGKYETLKMKHDKQVSGKFYGLNISFKRTYGDHTFTDEEAEKLLNGEIIDVVVKGYKTTGRLQRVYKEDGNFYYRFVSKGEPYAEFKEEYGADDLAQEYIEGMFNGSKVKIRRFLGKHRFTDQEVADLLAGKIVISKNLNGKDIRGRIQLVKDPLGYEYYDYVWEGRRDTPFQENL